MLGPSTIGSRSMLGVGADRGEGQYGVPKVQSLFSTPAIPWLGTPNSLARHP